MSANDQFLARKVAVIEGRVDKVERSLKELRDDVDDLPAKFAAIVDQRNLFYVKSFGRKVIYVLSLIAASAMGALGKLIVEAMF